MHGTIVEAFQFNCKSLPVARRSDAGDRVVRYIRPDGSDKSPSNCVGSDYLRLVIYGIAWDFG